MRMRYFPDTDTLLITLNERPVSDTRDVGENTVVDLDEKGHVVAITLEHAREQTDVRELSYRMAGT